MALITGKQQVRSSLSYALISFLLYAMPHSSFAAEWKVIADTSLGQIRMDTSTRVKTDGYDKAWFSYDFKKTQRLADPLNIVFSQRTDLVNINCPSRLFGISQSDFFDEGHIVYSKQIEITNVKFTTVAPDTMAEKLFDALCTDDTAK